MENLNYNNENEEESLILTPEKLRKNKRNDGKRIIEGVTYVRDAFGCYFPESYLTQRPQIRVPKDALPALSKIRISPQEIFMVLDLDGCHKVIEAREVTVGLANQSQIHPRETFRGAILNNAVSILVAHNHPSGNLEPSPSDLDATRKLVDAGKIMGITVLDHLIVAATGFYSIREHHSRCFSD